MLVRVNTHIRMLAFTKCHTFLKWMCFTLCILFSRSRMLMHVFHGRICRVAKITCGAVDIVSRPLGRGTLGHSPFTKHSPSLKHTRCSTLLAACCGIQEDSFYNPLRNCLLISAHSFEAIAFLRNAQAGHEYSSSACWLVTKHVLCFLQPVTSWKNRTVFKQTNAARCWDMNWSLTLPHFYSARPNTHDFKVFREKQNRAQFVSAQLANTMHEGWPVQNVQRNSGSPSRITAMDEKCMGWWYHACYRHSYLWDLAYDQNATDWFQRLRSVSRTHKQCQCIVWCETHNT